MRLYILLRGSLHSRPLMVVSPFFNSGLLTSAMESSPPCTPTEMVLCVFLDGLYVRLRRQFSFYWLLFLDDTFTVAMGPTQHRGRTDTGRGEENVSGSCELCYFDASS